ncbi:MAG: galactokinase [Kiritimatiellales bacterium]|nr:galactokinase [Kiritimatiellales bacterium]
MFDKNLIEETKQIHRQQFGKDPDVVAYAPGRIEVLGNHTDYNEGTVLSAAINMGHCFCISKSDKPGIRLMAIDVDAVAEFDLDTPGKVEGYGWANYSKGVMTYLREKGIDVGHVDCSFLGTIPMGAGLSSSAALEVATAYAVLALTGREMDRKEIAKVCQRAEHEYAGVMCGLLDQFSSIYGVEHGLIHSDFRTLEVSNVSLPDGVVFLMVNSKVKHSLVDSEYNERRERCEQAAREFAALLDHPVTALRDVSWDEFVAHRDEIDPAAAKRACHVVGEIMRVEKSMELLSDDGLAEFGQFLFDSHDTSRYEFENSCEELDVIVDAAKEAGALGARLSGGGFGGSVVVLIRNEQVDAMKAAIRSAYKRRCNIDPDIAVVIPSAGACVVSSE